MDDFNGVGASSADNDVNQDQSEYQKSPTSPPDVPLHSASSSNEGDLAPVAGTGSGTSNINETSSRVQKMSQSDSDIDNEPLLDTNSNSKLKRLNPFNKNFLPSKDAFNFRKEKGPDASSSIKTEVLDPIDGQQSEQSTEADKILKKPLNEILNDAGQFSFVALCSIKLTLLFEDEWNK